MVRGGVVGSNSRVAPPQNSLRRSDGHLTGWWMSRSGRPRTPPSGTDPGERAPGVDRAARPREPGPTSALLGGPPPPAERASERVAGQLTFLVGAAPPAPGGCRAPQGARGPHRSLAGLHPAGNRPLSRVAALEGSQTLPDPSPVLSRLHTRRRLGVFKLGSQSLDPLSLSLKRTSRPMTRHCRPNTRTSSLRISVGHYRPRNANRGARKIRACGVGARAAPGIEHAPPCIARSPPTQGGGPIQNVGSEWCSGHAEAKL